MKVGKILFLKTNKKCVMPRGEGDSTNSPRFRYSNFPKVFQVNKWLFATNPPPLMQHHRLPQ